jgi:hypothetical protein
MSLIEKKTKSLCTEKQTKPSKSAPGTTALVIESRLLYDRAGAARQLSISVRSLDYLISNKRLETRRIGKKVLVTHASLVRYASGNHFALTSRSEADTEDSGERCA